MATIFGKPRVFAICPHHIPEIWIVLWLITG